MKIDKFINIGGFVISIVTLLIVILQYVNEPDPLKETRISTYKDMIDITGKIINTQNNDSLTKLTNQFTEIYWGYYMLVNDSLVAKVMKRFKFELEDKIKGKNNIYSDKYKLIGEELIETCQKSIIKYK